jgi:hypothetical protein
VLSIIKDGSIGKGDKKPAVEKSGATVMENPALK